MQLIDLSVPINELMPVYPGDPKTKIKPAGSFHKDGYVDHSLSIGTHAGTHIDAPMHMLEHGKGLDQFPLEQFTGRGVLINVTDKPFTLATVQAVAIAEGDIVFFHTGKSDVFAKPEYFIDYAAIPE